MIEMIEEFREGRWQAVKMPAPTKGTPEEKTAEHKAFKHAFPAADVDPYCPECVWFMRNVKGQKTWGSV